MGHTLQGSVWLDTLPVELHLDFFRDRVGLHSLGPCSLLVISLFILF